MLNISHEIKFQTSRSGGKGGQNVNKVETAVTGFFHVDASQVLSAEQKQLIKEKLGNRINAEGDLLVKSQAHRTQLANKEEVVKKFHELIATALRKKKLRIATKPSKKSKETRLESKKRKADIKSTRKRYRPGD